MCDVFESCTLLVQIESTKIVPKPQYVIPLQTSKGVEALHASTCTYKNVNGTCPHTNRHHNGRYEEVRHSPMVSENTDENSCLCSHESRKRSMSTSLPLLFIKI